MIPIPIMLITGFLGAGKTTFLNWLIHSNPDKKISLILNEFGSIKLESQFIQEHSGGVITELANGCMCCVANSDIPRVVDFIIDNAPHTEYILIEASGLSDPDPIRQIFHDEKMVTKVVLFKTVCIVDVVNYEANRSDHSIITSQIGDADIIVISKAVQAGEEKVKRVQTAIESIGIDTAVVVWNDSLEPALFFDNHNLSSSQEEDVSDVSADQTHTHYHEAYDQHWFISKHSIDKDQFSTVMKSLPACIIRAKGFINCLGEKYMVQYVEGSFDMFSGEWNGEEPCSQVLFLGKNIEWASIQKQLMQCELL